MMISLKKALVMRVFFFVGRPEEKASIVSRQRYHGFSLLLMPNTYLGPMAKEGEEWRVAIDRIDADPDTKTARAYGRLLEKVGDLSKIEIGNGKRSTFSSVRPARDSVEAARTVSSVLAPKPAAKNERRRHSRSEFDRQLRSSMKGSSQKKDPSSGGSRKKQKA